jgi:hypothetical protein
MIQPTILDLFTIFKTAKFLFKLEGFQEKSIND